MQTKKLGFSLIELLVVIVIMGILATISIGTFSGFFERARDSKRTTTVDLMSNLIKTTDATVWDDTKYDFLTATDRGGHGVDALKELVFVPNDVEVPADEDLCYFYGFSSGADTDYAGDNEYFIAAWNEQNNKAIVSGTVGSVDAVEAAYPQDSESLRPDFSCTSGDMGTFTTANTGYTVIRLNSAGFDEL